MSQVHAEIEELRHFARNLNTMGQMLQEQYSKLRQQVGRVNDTWRDKENAIFMEHFIEKADAIYTIAEHMYAYSQFINRKTDILEQYIQTRIR